MCRCAHECDALELRLHGVSAHFCDAWRNRRFYGSAFVGMFNLSLWTQGRALLLGLFHALCILSVRCEQHAHDRISGYGLGLRLTYYFHDKHFICFCDPNACACDQFNLTVIDKMLAGMYTVCIDELRQVKQHGTEKLKKGSISDG